MKPRRKASRVHVATRTYTLEIEPAEEGGYVVTCPTLGCATQGETYEEAVAMGRECVEGWIEALVKAGRPVPVEPEPKRKTKAVVQVTTTAAA
jgi:antitoxin HicB